MGMDLELLAMGHADLVENAGHMMADRAIGSALASNYHSTLTSSCFLPMNSQNDVVEVISYVDWQVVYSRSKCRPSLSQSRAP